MGDFNESDAITRGKKNYVAALEAQGKDKWKTCAKKGGMATAACLHDLKLETSYDFDAWSDRWEAKMKG